MEGGRGDEVLKEQRQRRGREYEVKRGMRGERTGKEGQKRKREREREEKKNYNINSHIITKTNIHTHKKKRIKLQSDLVLATGVKTHV